MNNVQPSNEKKKSFTEKIMRLILEDVIMPDRQMSDNQMYSFCNFFSTLKKLD